MNDLKFRLIKDNKIIGWLYIREDDTGGGYNGGISFTPDHRNFYKEIPAFEFCNVYKYSKDKDDTPIYEGDIVEDNSGKIVIEERCNVKIIKSPTNATTECLWEKVIGNIYKNPELLKK